MEMFETGKLYEKAEQVTNQLQQFFVDLDCYHKQDNTTLIINKDIFNDIETGLSGLRQLLDTIERQVVNEPKNREISEWMRTDDYKTKVKELRRWYVQIMNSEGLNARTQPSEFVEEIVFWVGNSSIDRYIVYSEYKLATMIKERGIVDAALQIYHEVMHKHGEEITMTY